MEEVTGNETIDNSYHKPERLAWLMGEYEKHLHRFEASRKSMDQKAIWALATATGFVGFLGVVKRKTISAVLYSRFTNQVVDIDITQKIMILTALLFALVYIVLLIKVIRVYFPKEVIDPFMPTNNIQISPVSLFKEPEENERINDQYLDWSIDDYILPSETDHFYNVLREYLDVIVEQYLQNQNISKELRFTFRLLPLMAVMTITLFVLG